MLMINDGEAMSDHHVPSACDPSQAPFFCPFVAVVVVVVVVDVVVVVVVVAALVDGFSEFSILLYMPLIAGTVTPGRGQ